MIFKFFYFLQIQYNNYYINKQIFCPMQKMGQQSQPELTNNGQTQVYSLQTVYKNTPLQFRLKINGQYYISYHKREFWWLMVRSIAWFLINLLIISVVNNWSRISDQVKWISTCLLITQNILHLLLCYIDPGTLFEDQEDEYDNQRVYCLTCTLYRFRKSTKHCLYCNKCVRNYDHHCGVFNKCIGGRNIIIFYGLLIVSSIEMPGLIILFIYQLIGTQ